MRYSVRHDGIVFGTASLPERSFAAGRLVAAAGYDSIATVVRQATQAFLQLGLFCDVSGLPTGVSNPSELLQALSDAATLGLTLHGTRGEPVATWWVNLLDPNEDDGVVVLVSFREPTAMATSSISGPLKIDTASALDDRGDEDIEHAP